MSRPTGHLPPRCPLPLPPQSRQSLIRFRSLDSILEEEPPSWFDELLTCSDGDPMEVHHRRSASDSTPIPEAPASLQCPVASAESDASSVALPRLEGIGEGAESCCGIGGNCVYGPNSPRQKSKMSDPEVTALLESIPRDSLQYVALEYPNQDAASQSAARRCFHAAESDLDQEKAARRRSGQRSRVRKLQYIAELERTVEIYQTLGAELAAGVASLFQQRVALSVENKQLRQQIAGLRHEKTIKDGHYRTLKSEVDRLKVISGCHRRSKSASSSLEMGAAEADPFVASWQMLDFGKINLSVDPVPLRHGFGC